MTDVRKPKRGMLKVYLKKRGGGGISLTVPRTFSISQSFSVSVPTFWAR